MYNGLFNIYRPFDVFNTFSSNNRSKRCEKFYKY